MVLRKEFLSEFIWSQIFCYLILDGWADEWASGPEKNVSVKIYNKPNLVSGVKGGGGLCKWNKTKQQASKRTSTLCTLCSLRRCHIIMGRLLGPFLGLPCLILIWKSCIKTCCFQLLLRFFFKFVLFFLFVHGLFCKIWK